MILINCFYCISFIDGVESHVGFYILVVCCTTFMVQVPLQVVLMLLALKKFYCIIRELENVHLNLMPMKVQLVVLIFWMGSTIY